MAVEEPETQPAEGAPAPEEGDESSALEREKAIREGKIPPPEGFPGLQEGETEEEHEAEDEEDEG